MMSCHKRVCLCYLSLSHFPNSAAYIESNYQFYGQQTKVPSNYRKVWLRVCVECVLLCRLMWTPWCQLLKYYLSKNKCIFFTSSSREAISGSMMFTRTNGHTSKATLSGNIYPLHPCVLFTYIN
jgi:hypothetical protein